MTVEALKGIEGITSREAERSKNFFALGLMSWLYGRPIENTLDFIEAKFAGRPELVEANTRAFKAGLPLRRDERGLRRPVRGEAGQARAGRLPRDHGQPGALARPRRSDRCSSGLDALPRRVSDHAGLGHPRGARALQALRCPHVPGGGRDRGGRRGARRVVRRRPRRDDVGRPGHRPQVGDGGARGRARAAARDRRRAARGAVHGHADEAGAGGPADGDVRSQLRVASARARCIDGRATASTLRWRPAGSRSPTARPSTSSRTRTSRTAPSRGSSPTSTRCPISRSSSRRSRTPRAGSCPTCAIPRRSRASGRFPGRPASSTGSADSRRRT